MDTNKTNSGTTPEGLSGSLFPLVTLNNPLNQNCGVEAGGINVESFFVVEYT